jgi:3-deoxy-D-manno-octulosonic-acid transferase
MLPRLINILYSSLVIPSLELAQTLGATTSKKFAERARGTHETWNTLEALRQLDAKSLGAKRTCFWFHAASMGEFEQVKPIIEAVKERLPAARVVVSFFSPSGFRHQNKYRFADAALYLPLDSKRNARRFLDALRPTVVVFSRYDLWMNILAELNQRGIPAFVVCATLNERSLALRLPPARELVRRMYSSLQGIYTAGESETEKFRRLGVEDSPHAEKHASKHAEKLITSADTRFDRIASLVMQAQEQRSLGIPQNWFANPVLLKDDIYEQVFTLVLGSSWQPDEDIVFGAVSRLVQEYYVIKLVIAPHEPSAERTRLIQTAVRDAIYPGDVTAAPVALSTFEKNEHVESDWGNDIIVDSIGKLLRLYVYGNAVFVGGGFGTGVHSTTEPAGYGLPLACGPRIERARDAIALERLGALTVVRNEDECYQWLKTLLDDHNERTRRGALARDYVFGSTGWSAKIADRLVAETTPDT